MSGLLDDLRGAVGGDHVLTDDRRTSYVTDWTGRWSGSTPAVVRPGGVDEVAAVVECCRRHGAALVPQGGNTGLVGGSVPLDGEVVVSTARLAAITDVDADAGQLTAGAGVTLAAVQEAARRAGWAYAVDLAARDSATIGGTVATNAGGLHVVAHGATRAQIVGVEAVLGTGDVVSDLGGLTKDNTGYDLASLLCGSEGTLGIVSRVRVRLIPAAAQRVAALVGFATVAEAVTAAGVARRADAGVEALELVLAGGVELVGRHLGTAPPFDPLPPVLLLVEAAGADPVEPLAAAVDAMAGVRDVAVATEPGPRTALWRHREAHTEAIAALGVPVKLDVTLPGPALAGFVDEAPTLVASVAPGAETWLFGHVGDGNVHVNVTGAGDRAPAVTEAVLGRVVELGGSVSAEHGIGRQKVDWLVRQRGAGAVAAMRTLKAALDPDGILNPAVLVPAG